MDTYRDAIAKKYRNPNVELILAIPGELTQEKIDLLASAHVSLWDRQWILAAAAKAGRLAEAQEILGAAALRNAKPRMQAPPSPGQSFEQQLTSTPKGKPSWSLYQKLCKNI